MLCRRVAGTRNRDWEAFAKVLPAERRVVGNAHTITLEQDNSNTVNTLQNSNLPPLVLH